MELPRIVLNCCLRARYQVLLFFSFLPPTLDHFTYTSPNSSEISASYPASRSPPSRPSGGLDKTTHKEGDDQDYEKYASSHLQILSIIKMEFQEDSISDFILYKLNNPLALEKEMRLIEDRKECVKKLEEYSKQMDDLKNELNAQTTILETLMLKRNSIEQGYYDQINEIERQVVECREKIDLTKKATKDKQNSSQTYTKKYEEFQKEIVIRKQRTIQEHTQQLTDLDEETERLAKQKEQKKVKREVLEGHLKKLKDRAHIVSNTVANIEGVKNKWKTKHAELQVAKEEQLKKEAEIDELLRLSKSMEKVIYGNLYKRCGQAVGQLKHNLDILYKYDSLEDESETDRLEKLLAHLKLNKNKIMLLIKAKRDKYRVNEAVPEPQPKQYNFIVETKLSPDLLPSIDPSEYNINDQMYFEIEEDQDNMLDRLEEEKEQFFRKQKAMEEEIQSLQKRLLQFQDQIDIKRRTILSPTRKRR